MIGALVLIGLTTVAAITDLWWQKIYNATTYTGMVAALVLAGVTTLQQRQSPTQETEVSFWSLVQLSDCVAGLVACGAVLLLCFVLFRIGGGDVKLLAMMGAFLGLSRGLEAMLWTFVIGLFLGLATLIWRVGAANLITRAVRHVLVVLKYRTLVPLEKDEREHLKYPLGLAPAAFLAELIVVTTDVVNRLG